jgi:DNA-binding protein H-NS
MNLDSLDSNQLDALIKRAETRKAHLRERLRLDLRGEFERRAAAEGFTLSDIVAGKAGKPANRRPAYVHPDDPSKTWSGLGRVPSWLKTIANDGDIERFRMRP